jgi:hypothetical protein
MVVSFCMVGFHAKCNVWWLAHLVTNLKLVYCIVMADSSPKVSTCTCMLPPGSLDWFLISSVHLATQISPIMWLRVDQEPCTLLYASRCRGHYRPTCASFKIFSFGVVHRNIMGSSIETFWGRPLKHFGIVCRNILGLSIAIFWDRP